MSRPKPKVLLEYVDKKTYKSDKYNPKGFGYCAHSKNIGTIKNGKYRNKLIISSTSKGIKR